MWQISVKDRKRWMGYCFGYGYHPSKPNAVHFVRLWYTRLLVASPLPNTNAAEAARTFVKDYANSTVLRLNPPETAGRLCYAVSEPRP
jgi:hypothetical protein